MNEIFNKIKFILRKPKVVIIANDSRRMLREMVSKILKQHFRAGNEILIFEASSSELEKFQFFIQKSPLSVLVSTEGWVEIREKKVGFKKTTFGFEEGVDFQATDIKLNGNTNFKINYQGKVVPVWLKGVCDKEKILAGLAAAAVGTIFGLNLIKISQALREIQ